MLVCLLLILHDDWLERGMKRQEEGEYDHHYDQKRSNKTRIIREESYAGRRKFKLRIHPRSWPSLSSCSSFRIILWLWFTWSHCFCGFLAFFFLKMSSWWCSRSKFTVILFLLLFHFLQLLIEWKECTNGFSYKTTVLSSHHSLDVSLVLSSSKKRSWHSFVSSSSISRFLVIGVTLHEKRDELRKKRTGMIIDWRGEERGKTCVSCVLFL